MHPATAFLKTIASPLEWISNQRILQRMSIKETRTLAEKLVRSLDEEFDIVIGIKNGGVPPARYVAERLDLPFETMKISHYNSSMFKETPYLKNIDARIRVIEPPSLTCRSMYALIIDDDCRSGKTLLTAKNLFRGAAKTGVLVDFQRVRFEPDYCGIDGSRTGMFIMWPWNDSNPEYVDANECVL